MSSLSSWPHELLVWTWQDPGGEHPVWCLQPKLVVTTLSCLSFINRGRPKCFSKQQSISLNKSSKCGGVLPGEQVGRGELQLRYYGTPRRTPGGRSTCHPLPRSTTLLSSAVNSLCIQIIFHSFPALKFTESNHINWQDQLDQQHFFILVRTLMQWRSIIDLNPITQTHS